MEKSTEKIAVLVSGGVDSSVALALLKEAGFDVTAFYIKIWLEDELAFLGDCPWEEDLAFVRAVTEKLGVPLEIVPFQKEYWERVVAEAINEVGAGRTPNPDMLCNARIKFGAFYESIGERYDKIATGHYAQLEKKSGKVYLKKTPDTVKDQTYFLSQLSKEQLSRALFPIGQYTKPEVRALALKFALPNAKRKDSQGICFLGKIPFDAFLRHHLGTKKGALVECETGKTLGEHNGFWYFTIGQREGIGLSGGPWYVVGKEAETNTVFISHAEHRAERARDTFIVRDLNWFNEKPEDGMELSVKLRHGPKEYLAQVQWQDKETLEVHINEKDPGLASGQYAVFYSGVYCLGGGVISV
ncbi:MAG: tRNA 2-thiouridine(34) synthase MnmA [Candidatus Moraniibacteriota bacterium]